MRILYLTYGKQSGVIMHLCRALEAQGHSTSVRDVAKDFSYSLPNIKFPSLKPYNILNALMSLIQYRDQWKMFYKRTNYAFRFMSSQAEKILRKEQDNFDIIMQSGVMFSSFFPGKKRPYVLYLDHTFAISKKYEHIEGLPDYRRVSTKWEEMEKETYANADMIFTMSEFVKRSLIEDYGIIPGKVTVVGAGPNLEAIPNEFVKNEEEKRILFVGKDFKRKGGAVLLEAFKRVRKELPEVVLTIVGPAENIEGEGVENFGMVSHEKMPEIYRKADVFVMPTLREPFGLAFIEAMAYGLPCIGTKIEAVSEIISDGESGYLIDVDDCDALSEKLLILLKSPEKCQKLGFIGTEKVKSEFNWDRTGEKIIQTLLSL